MSSPHETPRLVEPRPYIPGSNPPARIHTSNPAPGRPRSAPPQADAPTSPNLSSTPHRSMSRLSAGRNRMGVGRNLWRWSPAASAAPTRLAASALIASDRAFEARKGVDGIKKQAACNVKPGNANLLVPIAQATGPPQQSTLCAAAQSPRSTNVGTQLYAAGGRHNDGVWHDVPTSWPWATERCGLELGPPGVAGMCGRGQLAWECTALPLLCCAVLAHSTCLPASFRAAREPRLVCVYSGVPAQRNS